MLGFVKFVSLERQKTVNMNKGKSHKILVTRKLNPEQLKFGENFNLVLTDKAFIHIEIHPILNEKLDLINHHSNACWIFTSQNAVKCVENYLEKLKHHSKIKCFAVGEKTAESLSRIGIHAIVPKKHHSVALVDLLKKHKVESCIYFTGNLRQNTISNYFIENGIDFEEIECYETLLNQPEIDVSEYAGICFCSPSAVSSFFAKYSLAETIPCFAIGPTTAVKLIEFSDHVILSESSNLYSMFETCHNYLEI